MQIEPSFLFQLAVGACALLGFVWRYNLYVEKKIEQHRVATETHIIASGRVEEITDAWPVA